MSTCIYNSIYKLQINSFSVVFQRGIKRMRKELRKKEINERREEERKKTEKKSS